ncbi:hypothetical protein GCM10009836_28540 [Pseudonocardia ailaonensis]|uniref:Uncharacterized protein n=1 Tax=Pseudonocardia ailaonensis TaxID=367279 RepID=A0ABN2N188_9PSEU
MSPSNDHPGRRSSTREADAPPATVTVPAQRRAPAQERAEGSGELHGCRCGHQASSHEHFRAGTDCAACDCGRYVSTTGLARQLAAILRRDRG